MNIDEIVYVLYKKYCDRYGIDYIRFYKFKYHRNEKSYKNIMIKH